MSIPATNVRAATGDSGAQSPEDLPSLESRTRATSGDEIDPVGNPLSIEQAARGEEQLR